MTHSAQTTTASSSSAQSAPSSALRPSWMHEAAAHAQEALTKRYGSAEASRAARGIKQVADFWREQDGSREAFEEFVETYYAGTQAARDTMFGRLQTLLEKLGGHMNEISREFRQQNDLELGPVMPFDDLFAGYDVSAHINDDFFANKIAFTVLLNFPLTTLEERLASGSGWSRREWAETKLAERFSKRIPADVSLAVSEAVAVAERYIAGYNIWMHHLLNDKNERLFPAKMRLLSHWNLRDEIKADYADTVHGLEKQRMITRVMERIVTQTIP
ncbi:MAG TPA: hypothetical protein VK470_16375, partial [Bacteroidota bacterium]|nr:hypothetical protein [Bacteroidota bacterium]